MGGVLEGMAIVLSGPEGPYVRLERLVSTANNGGFIQIRTKIRMEKKMQRVFYLKLEVMEKITIYT